MFSGGGGVIRTRVAGALTGVIEAKANLGPLGKFKGSAQRLVKPGTRAPGAAAFDLPPLPGALHLWHRLRGDAGGRGTADLGPLLLADHRSKWHGRAGGRHGRALAGHFLIRRKVGESAGPIPSDAESNSAVEPSTAAQTCLGQLRPSIATAVRGRFSGAGYRVVDFAVAADDADPGSLLESVPDQRPPESELSSWLSTDQQHHQIAICAVAEVRRDETHEDVGGVPLNRHTLGALDAASERPIFRAIAMGGTSITARNA